MQKVYKENIEWCDTWVAQTQNTSDPRVLLIGDSITRSYYNTVAQNLRGQFTPARLTTSSCVCDNILLKQFELLLSEYQFDIIHFNNGLHGWDYSEEEYGISLEVFFNHCKDNLKNSTLLWANTTPVRTRENPEILDDKNKRVCKRNDIAAKICKENDIAINDLYTKLFDHSQFYVDTVHLNGEGQKFLGDNVSKFILETNTK
jgi:hypothetical protein